MATCSGAPLSYDQFKSALNGAGYFGPYDFPSMLAAYQNAAKCTPIVTGYNDGTSSGPGSTPPSSTPTTTTPPTTGTVSTGIPQLDSAIVWAQANPILAVGGLGFIGLLIFGRRL